MSIRCQEEKEGDVLLKAIVRIVKEEKLFKEYTVSDNYEMAIFNQRLEGYAGKFPYIYIQELSKGYFLIPDKIENFGVGNKYTVYECKDDEELYNGYLSMVDDDRDCPIPIRFIEKIDEFKSLTQALKFVSVYVRF